MSQAPKLSISLAVFALLGAPALAGGDVTQRAGGDFFETYVRPVLSESCTSCHGPKKQSSGLRLDSREAILKGGDLGPAMVPGKPAESLLLQVVEHTHEELKMPPKGKLPAPAIEAFRRWIEMGAPWAEEHPATAATAPDPKEHWAFRPLHAVAEPAVRDRAWVRTPVDAFILARLEREGISPSQPADRRTLIRRATIDLLGVPPTVEEIEAFEADRSPRAFEKVVDRLLASPLYGERWGRHWLDVARYADTKGYVFTEDRRYPYAFTYRDYVVDAFNEDRPFDRFIVEQLAADQLELGGDPRPLAAMGFLTVGRRFLNDQNEIIDDRIDLVGRGLLGLSLSCARCHDHKFDPIPSEDYYSLYGVFASSVEPGELPRIHRPGVVMDPDAESLGPEVMKARRERDDFVASRRGEIEKEFRDRFSQYFRAAYAAGMNRKGGRLDAIAAERKLEPHRLRAALAVLKRRIEREESSKDAVVGPLAAFAKLPKDRFVEGSAEVCRNVTATLGKPDGPHPLVAALFTDGKPPRSMDEVVGRYADLLASIEAPALASPFADRGRDSLRLLVYGPDGLTSLAHVDPKVAIYTQPDIERYADLGNALKAVEAKWTGRAGRAMVMHDSPHPVEPRVFLRGNPGRPGKPVPRQFLQVLAGPERKPFQKGSGRRELADAIIAPSNPLTARVLANRVWAWHFGQGLVTTPSDFGLRCDPPSHPELLDDLAASLRDGGWSVKALHRRIMLSSTYQQRSDLRPEVHDRDPQNRLVWRFNRQRLDFEAMRDSILAASGTLDRTMGGPSTMLGEPPFPTRRTIYGFIDRQNLDSLFRTFDFAIPDATSPRRFVTTVPQQALFLMNSPFIQQQATRLAASVEQDARPASAADAGPAQDRIRLLYRRVLGREPEAGELELGASFLDSNRAKESREALPPLAQLAQVLLLTNEFTFVD
ncbi:PSD1 and planctomycete cytochrome C domain-containing protein [Aquisphaera insulae]|uniref:PSD1 and planctomycete cytochrome C domain-containing protein n=1 Tax=Aquisphaera insulae TaxID=2712864 RepID=UPI0013E9E3E7|nr:DUF1553 domain-containing protein [Aquisphaera insulae]